MSVLYNRETYKYREPINIVQCTYQLGVMAVREWFDNFREAIADANDVFPEDD